MDRALPAILRLAGRSLQSLLPHPCVCVCVGATPRPSRHSSDPWAQVVYDQYRSGRALASFGFGAKDTEGHTFVVHNYAGVRVTCAVIPNVHS